MATILVALLDHQAWSPAWLMLVLAGVVLFTFTEYVTHRWLLHRLLWHGTHERHHTHPHEYVVFPVWYLPTVLLGFYLVLPTPVFVGFMVGVVYFLVFHHALHHWDLRRRPWLRQYGRWHDVHHSGAPKNYGITSPLFDWAFGTYQPAPGRQARAQPHTSSE